VERLFERDFCADQLIISPTPELRWSRQISRFNPKASKDFCQFRKVLYPNWLDAERVQVRFLSAHKVLLDFAGGALQTRGRCSHYCMMSVRNR
jgi:hypothetical protein